MLYVDCVCWTWELTNLQSYVKLFHFKTIHSLGEIGWGHFAAALWLHMKLLEKPHKNKNMLDYTFNNMIIQTEIETTSAKVQLQAYKGMKLI